MVNIIITHILSLRRGRPSLHHARAERALGQDFLHRRALRRQNSGESRRRAPDSGGAGAGRQESVHRGYAYVCV
jgi:hypothetical protein